jgi:hypothetical protein
MEQKIHRLISIAQEKMAQSLDLMHDMGHTQRVVNFVEQISKEFSLTEEQRQATILAAWWHDVSRATRGKPSYIWINFMDDIISAFLLMCKAASNRTLGRTSSLAIRVVACKSMATGAILTKLLLRKKDRFLVDIIKDADYLDVLNPERNRTAYKIVDGSHLYNLGYRFLNWWLFCLKRFKLKTFTARQILKKLLQEFISWIKNTEIYYWHVQTFGYAWVEKGIRRIEKRIFKIQCTV